MKNIILCIVIISCQIKAVSLLDYYDKIVLSGETYFFAPNTISKDIELSNIWLYASLPNIKLKNRSIFSAIEYDYIYRPLDIPNSVVSDGNMHRVGLFAGYPVSKKKKTKGVFMVGVGAASDGEEFSNSFYIHLIYDQQFKISDKFTLGIGALVSYNLYSWKFNLLPTLDLKLNTKNALKIKWDSFEYDFLIQKWISLALSIRYDLSFYKLQKDYNFELETVSFCPGFDIMPVQGFIIRMRYKYAFYYSEKIKISGYDYLSMNNNGSMGFKISLVYGK